MEFLLLVIFVKKKGKINLKAHLFKLKKKKSFMIKKKRRLGSTIHIQTLKVKVFFIFRTFQLHLLLLKEKQGLLHLVINKIIILVFQLTSHTTFRSVIITMLQFNRNSRKKKIQHFILSIEKILEMVKFLLILVEQQKIKRLILPKKIKKEVILGLIQNLISTKIHILI